ncbi:oxidative stress-induced growth inhibitor 2-like [Acanthaster planci]|uniref:Oxidative stress-induced growth inhibitor 2-like n=1 Tax=Acanthaster planci TaxID=133434 RepID=A0A8B7ZCJ9_ACAPL|nr:oxidative stress-induced growth inhibitor 2-like [Acanthaster planci]XP_022100916.1 oxidative stress-induced growth inhibitor 2-like [Acanthaster planci]XP_022100917.1 oxidative stress-induced growth inhibitor 2-like [Acanthaster planci]
MAQLACSSSNEDLNANYCALDHCYSPAIIVGNGPSGISLSYLLSGNWPYYTGEPHPDPYLHARLLENEEQSILQQDLEFLSSGLEGRSHNPVAVLFDNLYQPNADLVDDEKSRLEWRYHPAKAVAHRVLGRGPPGGSWRDMDDSVRTLSQGRWMELPGVNFSDWVAEYRKRVGKCCNSSDNRATLGDVGRYYKEYVETMGLEKSFRPYTLVTSVQRLKGRRVINSESGEPEIQCQRCRKYEGQNLFEVKGHFLRDTTCCEKQVSACDSFTVLTPNVILATGMVGIPNRLNVPGEDLPYVLYSVKDLEVAIQQEDVHSNSDPVLIIGSGLNAADAVLAAQSAGVPVVHAFRRSAFDKVLIFSKLPESVYPEYHRVHLMMQQRGWEEGAADRSYISLPQHTVHEFQPGHRVAVKGPNACGYVRVSVAVVLIGSRPDLTFLPNDGTHLGVQSDGSPITYQHNPIEVNPYTMESTAETGLYAMGPLVGDNFVRFAKGGALAIASHICKKLQDATDP